MVLSGCVGLVSQHELTSTLAGVVVLCWGACKVTGCFLCQPSTQAQWRQLCCAQQPPLCLSPRSPISGYTWPDKWPASSPAWGDMPFRVCICRCCRFEYPHMWPPSCLGSAGAGWHNTIAALAHILLCLDSGETCCLELHPPTRCFKVMSERLCVLQWPTG